MTSGRLVAIASGKGGVGKTWLAITLGHALARRGRRVLLFDGDLGLANVDVQLGLGPGPDLACVLAGRRPMAETIRQVDDTGFELIAGRSGSGQLALVGPDGVARLLADLAAIAPHYDHVLLDLPAGIDRAVRTFLGAAQQQIVVTTDEPTALTDAYALIKVSHRDGRVPEVAVNQAVGNEAGRRTHDGLAKVCRQFLGVTPLLAGIVRHDPRVSQAIQHQVPLLVRSPNSAAVRDVEALAAHLASGR